MIAEGILGMFGVRSIGGNHPRDKELARLFGLNRPSSAGVKVDEESVLGLPAVWRGCDILSNGVAKVSPIIYQRTPQGRERAINHPSWPFIKRKAHRYISASAFRKTLTFHMKLWGNGIGEIQRDGAGRVVSGTPLPPHSTALVLLRRSSSVQADDPIEPDDQLIYESVVDGKLRSILPENVIHVHGLSYNGLWGYSVVEILQGSLGIPLATREFGAKFFGQGATASAILFMPPGMKEEQQHTFAKAIKEKYSGVHNSHKFMLLEHGADMKQLTIPPEHAQFLGTMEFMNRELALAIGIQPHKIGDQSRKSYNSLEQSNQEHLDDDLDPLLQVWEDELNDKCLTEREKEEETHYVEFNRKELVRTNLEAQTSRERFEREWGISTANDILRRNNQNPIGAVGDSYLVPQNMHVLGKDGLPIVLGTEIEPISDDATTKLVMETSMYRAEKFVEHAMRVAVERSKSGKDFLEFLDDLPHWSMDPECVAPLLYAAATFIVEQLSVFVEAPYMAKELTANVIAATPRIKDEALDIIRNELEKKLK